MGLWWARVQAVVSPRAPSSNEWAKHAQWSRERRYFDCYTILECPIIIYLRMEKVRDCSLQSTISDRAEIRGLLSGSEVAEAELARFAPGLAGQIERVVSEAFVYAFDGAMLLCMVVL